jgi:hypothetical protein
MARSNDWEKMAMAQGDPKPAWPLPTVTPKFATWSIGGGRPANCSEDKCERWHAGIDLTNAPDGSLIIAPEDALVIGVDRGWSEGSKATFLRTNTGLFIVLGGFKQGSHNEYGIKSAQTVRRGDKLGRVLGSYGMIHLETYKAEDRKANSVWWASEPPPDGLLNPTNYVERMVGDKVSLVQARQRHEALAALGYYTGAVGDPWGTASIDALRAAQQGLGVGVDGKWGPNTEDAIQRALDQRQGCTSDECAAAATGEKAAEHSGVMGRGGWWVVGAVAATGVAVGVTLALRSSRG